MSVEVRNISNAGAKISNDTDTLKKFAKVFTSSVDVITSIAIVCFKTMLTAFEVVRRVFSNTVSLIDGLGFFGTLYEFIDPAKRAEMVKSPAQTTQKTARLCGQALKLVSFVDGVSLQCLKAPALCLGKLPIIEVVANGFFLIDATIGTVRAVQDLQKGNAAAAKAKSERAPWDRRAKWVVDPAAFDIEAAKRKYEKKLEKLDSSSEKYQRKIAYSGQLEEANVEGYQNAKAERRLVKFKETIADSKTPEEQRPKLISYVNALEKPEKRISKLSDITAHEIKVSNFAAQHAKNDQIKAWISIAAEVGKIFMIVVGTLIVGLSFLFPVLTAPAIGLTLSLCGLASNVAGLAKNLYKDIWHQSRKDQINEKAEVEFKDFHKALSAA